MSQSVLLSRFSLLAVSAALALSAGALALAQNAVVDPAKNDLPNPNPRVVQELGTSARRQDVGFDGGDRYRSRTAMFGFSYAIDSESNPTRHPDWKTGVRIGSTTEDKVTAFIPPHPTGNPYGAVGGRRGRGRGRKRVRCGRPQLAGDCRGWRDEISQTLGRSRSSDSERARDSSCLPSTASLGRRVKMAPCVSIGKPLRTMVRAGRRLSTGSIGCGWNKDDAECGSTTGRRRSPGSPSPTRSVN